MKSKMILRLISLSLVAVFAISLLACSPLKSSKKESTVIMTVGGYEVPYEIYYYVSENIKKEGYTGEELEKESIDTIKELYSVFSLGEEFGIAYDDEYIKANADKAAEAAIAEYGSEKEYVKAIREGFLNDSTYRFLVRHNLTAETLFIKLRDSEKYAMDRDEQLSLAMSDEFIRIKQVLITSEGGTASVEDTYFLTEVEHTDEEALAIAEEVREKALAGVDFDRLVTDYGESLFMFNNTDGYYICRGMWDKVAEDCAFSLEIGEVSEVIETDGGFSVLLRCEKSEDYIKENLSEMMDEYYKALYRILIEERKESLEVKTNSAYDKYVK